MTVRLVSTPSSTKIAGHRSRTSTTNFDRFSLASTHALAIEKNVGDETTTTSGRPTARPARRGPLSMKLTCPRVFFANPSFGVAYSQVLTMRYPSTDSRTRTRRRYSGGITPVGWFGIPVRTVTRCPALAHSRANSDRRACGAPLSGGK